MKKTIEFGYIKYELDGCGGLIFYVYEWGFFWHVQMVGGECCIFLSR